MNFDYSASNRAYELFDIDKAWLHDIGNGFLVAFNPRWRNIAVNLSGGADSAAGTATLAKLIKDNGYNCKINVISNVRVWNNRPWAGPISIEVYEKLRSMFPDVIGERLQNFIPPEIEEGALHNNDNPQGILSEIGKSGDRLCIDSFNRFACHTYRLEAIYNFVTLNPIVDTVHTRRPVDRNWDLNNITEEFEKSPHVLNLYNNSYFITPWRLVQKDFVIAQYFINGWEELLETTRSCEGDRLLFPDSAFEDYTTYVHGQSPLPTCTDVVSAEQTAEDCCFWCVEREWAIKSAKEKLGIQ